ncbi:glycosyltransferase family 2 protein [Pseudobdellovibrio exovorus]|uniref:Glycosyltransferase 2-like domain-containing protein n=1 Tax=Pseudobdellovibrio exovorus JSS TaxID=1184267 RepID=M4VBI4_9BACT|nr:glycosyltransferase family 2 protein [Pseudobdellovibrio exovorus]AGH96568.1 hypothetical protein A11Q_2352 [Pseudobdellovibrio exovorus JSS]
MKIALAIPCYNCEPQILRVISELQEVIKTEAQIETVFLIDNISQDNTPQVALDFIKKNELLGFKVFQNSTNIGLGGTHKVAFTLAKSAGATHLLILHGDHQATAYDIPQLIALSKKHNGITVLGSRFSDTSLLSGYSLTRTYGNIALNMLYSLFTFRKISDLGSGLNLFRLSDFDSHLADGSYQNFDNGFTFNMDLLLHLVRTNTSFLYSPIRWSTTDQISNAKALQVGFKTLVKLFKWRVGYNNRNNSHKETRELTT